MTPLRIGLIGAGKHGSRYAKHIVEDLPQARLVAVCRRNRQEGEQFAVSYGCAYYSEFQDLVADPQVDAIIIVVPPAYHGAIVDAACRAGKSLLIEKPFAVDMAEACRMQDLIAANKVRCMVAHTLRFNAVVRTLKAYVHEITPLHSVYLSQRFEPSPLAWLDHKAESGGGIVLHTGVHSFDLLYFFTGCEVDTVWCQISQIVTRETEDNFVMMCSLREPLLKGAVIGSRSTYSRSGLIEISGEKGQLVGDHAHGFAYLLKGSTRTELSVPPPAPTVRETVQAFVASIQNDEPFPITVDDGVRTVAVAAACYRSVSTGKAAAVEMGC